MAMIEPWVTPWSRFVYTRLHHEPFQPETPSWELPTSGPLSGANDALPWIIFARDRIKFEQEFPQWQIEMIKPIMPFRYLLSGGVSLRGLAPGWSFGMWRQLENASQPLEQPTSHVCPNCAAASVTRYEVITFEFRAHHGLNERFTKRNHLHRYLALPDVKMFHYFPIFSGILRESGLGGRCPTPNFPSTLRALPRPELVFSDRGAHPPIQA